MIANFTHKYEYGLSVCYRSFSLFSVVTGFITFESTLTRVALKNIFHYAALVVGSKLTFIVFTLREMIVSRMTWFLLFLHRVQSNSDPIYSIKKHPFVATITDIPHHMLVVCGNLYCSGTLLRSRIVITTASCVTSKPDRQRIFIKAGGNSVSGVGQVIPVVDIKVHEYYRYYSKVDNDIAMLFLKENVQFNENVKKVLMTDSEDSLQTGSIIQVTGWGKQNLPQRFSNMLLWVDMAVIDKTECVDTYGHVITPSNFCARFYPPRHLSDIGGAAVYKKNLVGLLSFTTTKKHKQHIAIFTNTSYFKRWIKLNTIQFLEKYCVDEINESLYRDFSSVEYLSHPASPG